MTMSDHGEPDDARATAQLREGIREGSGLWFYDCPACPCDFGPMTRDKADAQRQAREHDAKYHDSEAPDA